jgi:FkbM family methyltransferase
MKFIDHSFPWTNKMRWAWTDDDVKLLQVINDVNDVTSILDQFVPDDRRHTCVQAGAACGIWPYRLSLAFDNVITVEPLPDNFECAVSNLEDRVENVRKFQGVLGSGSEGTSAGMKQHPNEKHNAGSQQVELHALEGHRRELLIDYQTSVPVFTIDGLVADDEDVTFIALDLEGYELPALEGAAGTIERCRPVIMVEDKGLSAKFGVAKGDVIKYLREGFGYRVGAAIKRDVVMLP